MLWGFPAGLWRWVWHHGSWWAARGLDTVSPKRWSLWAERTASSCCRWDQTDHLIVWFIDLSLIYVNQPAELWKYTVYTHICIHPVYISEPEKPDIKLSVISVTAEPHSSGWLVVWRRRRRNWISCQRSVGLQTAGSSLTLKVLRARTCLWFCVCWTGPKCCLLFAVTVPQCGQTTRRHQLQPDHRWTPGQRPGQPQRGETQHTVLHHEL